MTSTGDFYDLLRRKLEGTGIVVHALYRRVKPGLVGKEYFLTGLVERDDTRKYFDAKLLSDQLPSGKEAEVFADDIVAQLKAQVRPVILMN